MTSRIRALQLSDIDQLNSAISRAIPSLSPEEIEDVRSRIMQYIANGIENGYNVALAKATNDDEINLKILRLFEEDDED